MGKFESARLSERYKSLRPPLSPNNSSYYSIDAYIVHSSKRALKLTQV